jgi:hypothetical protein
MRQPLLSLAFVALLVAACPTSSGGDGGPTKLPPQVFLTVDDANVIGAVVSGKVNVSGCKNITQVQLLQGGSFLADVNYTTSPTAFTLQAGSFAGLYGKLGLAAELTLTAKVVCDDGRVNTSQPVGVSFFPVTSRLSTTEQLLPDTFTARGGLAGTKVSFVGCVGTASGATALAAFDTSGKQLISNAALPFTCSSNLVISSRSKATGIRWVMEPGVGAMAIDDNLVVQRFLTGSLKRMGVVSDTGVGLFWQDGVAGAKLLKRDPFTTNPSDWEYPVVGIMNSDPVVDDRLRLVWATTWQFGTGTGVGNTVAYEFNLDTGDLLNGVGGSGPPILHSQQYSTQAANKPIMPEGALSADGTLFYEPVLSQDNTGTVHTTVIACSTAGLCDGNMSARRWTSATFDGVTNLMVLFSAGNYLAAVGPYQVWFLETQLGTIKNLGEAPIRPTGSLQVLGVQPGINAEMYILNGPVSTGGTWPIEAVAVDRPESGELWRFTFGSGESPLAGLTMAVDETGQAWFRVGPDIVRPLPLAEYRTARGPTVLP